MASRQIRQPGYDQCEWGTAFWSQVYTDFSQIPVPLPSNGDPNPGLALDYDRYQSFANASFSNEQLAVLRKNCPRHFVTTNNVGAPADTLNLHELYQDLDFVSHDNYPGFIEIRYAPISHPKCCRPLLEWATTRCAA